MKFGGQRETWLKLIGKMSRNRRVELADRLGLGKAQGPIWEKQRSLLGVEAEAEEEVVVFEKGLVGAGVVEAGRVEAEVVVAEVAGEAAAEVFREDFFHFFPCLPHLPPLPCLPCLPCLSCPPCFP